MRIYRTLILASLALVTELDSAGGSKLSTNTYNDTLDSGHDHRVCTSGSALRVHEPVDEDDEERGQFGMFQLTKSFADQLLHLLAERFGDLSLSVALTGIASIENTPEYLITLRKKYFKRLVDQEMTPKKFVGVLRFPMDERKKHRYTSLELFLKAYNQKNKEARVSVLDTLRYSGYWETDDLLLKRLDYDKKYDPG
ncbi:hypothetical protein PsorP6_013197 [Peronosclerospora sorghi]|uniref:Uncharacterized protein n=1 Tax=Peronosclerospora sorghi TaxID=230839 RepID=A0ACC0WFX1_9STRA|nr:hypothetical protein PsorP6_013197 [Peronosclerospora sorghi]